MEAVIVMRVHLLVYCLFTAVCAHDGSPAVMCEPTSKMSTTAAAPLSIPVNSDVFLSESIAIVQERRAVDFNTRQKKARSQSSSAPCYIFFCSLIYLPLLLAIFAFVPFTLKRRAYVKKELLTLYFSQDNVKHLNRESVHLLETTALVIAAVHYFCLSSLILC